MSNRTAVDVAQEAARENTEEVITLQSGCKARYVPVAPALLQEVNTRIKEPPVPLFKREDGKTVENPTAPEYLKALRETANARSEAMMDIMVLMGVDLIDPVPDDEKWLPKLKYLEKKGRLDLSEFDLTVPLEREYVFKRFIAVGKKDLEEIIKRMGLTEEDIRKSEDTFPGKGQGPADK